MSTINRHTIFLNVTVLQTCDLPFSILALTIRSTIPLKHPIILLTNFNIKKGIITATNATFPVYIATVYSAVLITIFVNKKLSII